MSVQLHWNILKEEGRVLKAAADLLKLPCRFIPKHYNQACKCSTPKQTTFDSVQAIKLMSKINETKFALFGKTQQEKNNIQAKLSLYNNQYKHFLRFSIIDIVSETDKQIRKQLIKRKKQQIERKIQELDVILKDIATKFICGDNISIVDLLFYFDVCNMTYFGKNPSNYTHVWKWFQAVYRFKQVKIITHQWFAMAKEITPLLREKRLKAKL